MRERQGPPRASPSIRQARLRRTAATRPACRTRAAQRRTARLVPVGRLRCTEESVPVEVSTEELAIWIDVGDEDAWLPRINLLHEMLDIRGIEHEFNIFPGDHWGPYWAKHLPDYLRFYDAALHSR